MTKEAFYFPHDNNAHADPKMVRLTMALGLRGIGLYWVLIETMHKEENGMMTYKEFSDYVAFCISREEGTSVEEVLNTFFDCKLFLKTDDDFVYSPRVLENKEIRKDIVEKRRNAGKKSASARAKSTSVEHLLNKERKGKEKEKKELNIEDSNGAVAPITGPVLTEVYLFSPPQNEKATKTSSPKFVNLGFFAMDIEKILSAFDVVDDNQKEVLRVEIEKFREYWTEWNSTGTKMRWQMEKTFEVKKRLATWFGRVKNFTHIQYKKADRVGETINLF